MSDKISGKFHPIPSNLKKIVFFCGFHGNGGHFENSTQTMDINSQHHNLLGNQISLKSEDFCILEAIVGSKSSGLP